MTIKTKKEVSLEEFYYKVGELKNLCQYFDNVVIKGEPELDSKNYFMLAEIYIKSESSKYHAITETLFDFKEDLKRRANICSQIYMEEQIEKHEKYEKQVMSEESHLNPKITNNF